MNNAIKKLNRLLTPAGKRIERLKYRLNEDLITLEEKLTELEMEYRYNDADELRDRIFSLELRLEKVNSIQADRELAKGRLLLSLPS